MVIKINTAPIGNSKCSESFAAVAIFVRDNGLASQSGQSNFGHFREHVPFGA
jgi:hypothetical protein